MPWVNQEMCTGCGTCVEECPVGAIALDDDELAAIDEQRCIRCGVCHDACPVEAVRHDSERIPQEVEANLQWVRDLMGHFETDAEKQALVGRMVRYFTKDRKVADQTIQRLQTI
ncbi:MAG: 4Fe-4S binding protein [Planctomycetota bacterium]